MFPTRASAKATKVRKKLGCDTNKEKHFQQILQMSESTLSITFDFTIYVTVSQSCVDIINDVDKPTANSYILQVSSNTLIPILSLCQCGGEKLMMFKHHNKATSHDRECCCTKSAV